MEKTMWEWAGAGAEVPAFINEIVTAVSSLN